MVYETISQELRLNHIDETGNDLIEKKINQDDLMSKTCKKNLYCFKLSWENA